MRTDIGNWEPLPISKVVEIFSGIPVWWCVAGGWAFDLHLGKQSRQHSDVDIIILQSQQVAVFQYLSKEWDLYNAHEGRLSLLEESNYSTSAKDIWVCKDDKSPWVFQLMQIESEQGFWRYRREESITELLANIISTTKSGIPYLKPEVQLLYKGGSSNIRERDLNDFQMILPTLSSDAKKWLRLSLQKQFPEGYSWIDYLQEN